mmetsp:Transcript_26063/g.65545  ORF Transcript_26063/g.65545 Transcript_26063/m.65545 type:complete len:236 (-) Transcript_26063:979-1686(-)
MDAGVVLVTVQMVWQHSMIPKVGHILRRQLVVAFLRSITAGGDVWVQCLVVGYQERRVLGRVVRTAAARQSQKVPLPVQADIATPLTLETGFTAGVINWGARGPAVRRVRPKHVPMVLFHVGLVLLGDTHATLQVLQGLHQVLVARDEVGSSRICLRQRPLREAVILVAPVPNVLHGICEAHFWPAVHLSGAAVARACKDGLQIWSLPINVGDLSGGIRRGEQQRDHRPRPKPWC